MSNLIFGSIFKPPLATASGLLNASMLSICSFVCLFVCLSVCRQNAKNAIFSKTKQFRAMVSIAYLQEVVHGLFEEPIIGPLKSKMRRSAIQDLDANMQKAIFSKTKQFRAMVFIDDLQEVVPGLFEEPDRPLKSKMAEIRYLENRHDVIFFPADVVRFG